MNARLVALLVSIIAADPVMESASADPAQVRGVFYLKVREAPSFQAAEKGVLAEGDVVDIVGEVGTWANVVTENGTTGYVSRKYLGPLTVEEPGKDEPSEEAARREDGAKPEEAAKARAGTESVDHVEPPKETLGPQPQQEPKPKARVEKPQVAVTTSDRPRTHGPDPCSSADLDELRRELRALGAGQDRLAALLGTPRKTGTKPWDWSSSLSMRQMLFWLGTGCVIGWLAEVGLRYRRERRQRGRIRI